MTITDVKNALFTHFFTSSTFSVVDDVAGLGLSDKDLGEALAPHRAALVTAALNDMVTGGLLAPVAAGLYVLTQPLNVFSQQVVLSPLGAEMVADLVNEWHSMADEGGSYTANKMAINSHDIETLCHYLHFLLDEDVQTDLSTT